MSACAPAATRSRTASPTSPSSSGTITSPSTSIRSVIGRTIARGTSGSGRRVEWTSSASSGESPDVRPCPFITNIASSCPRVASRPVAAPRRSTIAFVPVVVPWTSRPQRSSTASSVEPIFVAASEIASKKPRDRSSGVVGDLPVVMCTAVVHDRAVGEGPADVDADGQIAVAHAVTWARAASFTSSTGGSSGLHSSVARVTPQPGQRN